MVNTPVGVLRPLLPVETVEAAITTPLRYKVALCVLRSMTRNRGPAETAFAGHTYWPGRRRVPFSTDARPCRTGCAAAEAAAHASNKSSISRFTKHLVRRSREQAPGWGLRLIAARAMAP